jgi:adenine deaminase
MVAAEDGKILAELQLNVGGILSDRPAKEIGEGLGQIRAAMQALGYSHYNPIMSFATITLTASPALKLTDKGLINVPGTKVVPLFVK